MEDQTEQGDCCPLPQEGPETKAVSFGPRLVRPDSYDAYTDKESARARSRQLGCIGIRQYGSTTGGTMWMPCSNESDYRKVTNTDTASRRQRRRMTKGLSNSESKVLGMAIGPTNQNTDPRTAIDADLDGLVLEGLPQINMGRGIPDPTPGNRMNVPETDLPLSTVEVDIETPKEGAESANRELINVRKPSQFRNRKFPKPKLLKKPIVESPGENASPINFSSLTNAAARLKKASGIIPQKNRRRKKNPKQAESSGFVTKNRMDLANIPSGILDVAASSPESMLTEADRNSANLISLGGADGKNSLNANVLFDSLSSQPMLRNFLAPDDSEYAAQLAFLVREGRLPNLAEAIIEMSPESVQDFLGVNPRMMVLAAQSASKQLRPSGGWISRISHDPFEVISHMLRAKDYHISAIASGFDSPNLSAAVDELVGNNASETGAIFGAIVANNKDRLSDAYSGSVNLSRSGNKMIAMARNLIAASTENDSVWSASRAAIAEASEMIVFNEDPSAAMGLRVSRYGRNYPARRRKSGDWSPIANKIRDRIQEYKNYYGPIAANSADLAKFVDFSYPELLDEASELIDVMKQKIEFGSLKLSDYAREGWADRDRAELALDEFDPVNLESIFDPGKQMGLLKAVGIVLGSAARIAPSPSEKEGIFELMSEVNEWGFLALPFYSEPRLNVSRRRGIFPSAEDPSASMRGMPDDVRRLLMSLSPPLGSDAQRRESSETSMRRKLIQRANEFLRGDGSDNVAEYLLSDPLGPVADISETFLSISENMNLNQDEMANLYEAVSGIMARMITDLPASRKREKLKSMFLDALEDINLNVSDANERFLSLVGDMPSRTIARLSRKIANNQIGASEDLVDSADTQRAGEFIGKPERDDLFFETVDANTSDTINEIADDGNASMTDPESGGKKRRPDSELKTIYDEVMRVVSMLDTNPVEDNPDDRKSFREKLLASGINSPFTDESFAAEEVPSERQFPIFLDDERNADAGVRVEGIENLEAILADVLDELGFQSISAENDTSALIDILKSRLSIKGGKQFDDFLRSFSPRIGEAKRADFADQVGNSTYFTESSIRSRVEARFPGFYEAIGEIPEEREGNAFEEDANASMGMGPLIDRIRQKIVLQREIRELGKLAVIDDAKDYQLRTEEAKRRRLVSLAGESGFLAFIVNGIQDQRSPLYLKRISASRGGLEPFLISADGRTITDSFNALSEFLMELRGEVASQNFGRAYSALYQAAKYKVLSNDPDARPANAFFSEEEFFESLEIESWDSLIPSREAMIIYSSDIDAVPSIRSKAEAALEVLALDRSDLLALLTNDSTIEEAKSQISGAVASEAEAAKRSVEGGIGKMVYVPTGRHMEQLSVAEAVSPLDSESLIAFVDTLDEAQMASLENMRVGGAAKELISAETKVAQYVGAVRKMFGMMELHKTEPGEIGSLEDRISQLIGEDFFSPSVSDLIAAVRNDDARLASEIIGTFDSKDEKLQADLLKTIYVFGRNSLGQSIASLLPTSIDEATEFSVRRIRAVGILKAESDGGRSLAKQIIDTNPKGGVGYDLVRILPEGTDRQKQLASLGDAIKEYDGSSESALKIIYSLSAPQLERLRRNYIIPSILQRMDFQAHEKRLEQSSVAETRARIDNLARTLESLTFGSEDGDETIEGVVSRIDEAMARAFGDRFYDITLLDKSERSAYGDIVNYFVLGGKEQFDDPNSYGDAIQKMRRPAQGIDDDTELQRQGDGSPSGADDTSSGDRDWFASFDLGGQPPASANDSDEDLPEEDGIFASMAQGNSQGPVPLPRDIAEAIFGTEIVNYVESGKFVASRLFPTTSNSEDNEFARKAISALSDTMKGTIPEDIAEKLRTDGVYAQSQMVFQALMESTLQLIRSKSDMPYSFGDSSDVYDPKVDTDADRRNFFLGVLTEYMSLHMYLGEELLPISTVSPTDPASRINFNMTRDDFQMVIPENIMNYYYVFNPGSPNTAVREEVSVRDGSSDEFFGDPSDHPDVKNIKRTMRRLGRSFPNFDDWLDQANRYSRILGTRHYEKDEDKFGEGLIDKVFTDPSSMDLDKVISQIASQFEELSEYSGDDAKRLFVDAANLSPNPDYVRDFPSLESYPNPDQMVGANLPKDRIAKQKKIAVSAAKSSEAARQSWWSMFTGSGLMDEYEIASVSKTTDGDNFHPQAILAGLRKYARDNNLTDTQFDSLYGISQQAASGRYNQVGLQAVIAKLNDINANSRGGIKGELLRLDQLLRQLDNQYKEISRHYQDRIRAQIVAAYSAVGYITSQFEAEENRINQMASSGQITPQEAVRRIKQTFFIIQPGLLAAVRRVNDNSAKTKASTRARNSIKIQREEVKERIREISEATKVAMPDLYKLLQTVRGINNGLSDLSSNPDAIDDDGSASMGIGNSRYGVVGTRLERSKPKRILLTSREKLLANEIYELGAFVLNNNVERLDRIPDMRSAMATLRGSTQVKPLTLNKFQSPAEVQQIRRNTSRILSADIDATEATKEVMGSRFTRFADLALNTLPSLTRRIAQDAVTDGFSVAMSVNGVGEADLDAALTMFAEANKNVKNLAIFNSLETTARILGVSADDVADSLATETLIKKTSNLLRQAQEYASGLSSAYTDASIRRMTVNRFPEIAQLSPEYSKFIIARNDGFANAERTLNDAISINKLMKVNPKAVSLAFGVSEDVGRFISESSVATNPMTEKRSVLPFDWNFMTFRDRQSWLSSEGAIDSLGRIGVNEELGILQRQIEEFGSLDGPYPALARIISGNKTTSGVFGRELVSADGISPVFASRGFAQSDLSVGGTNKFSRLVEAVPGIDRMSDRALSRFLNSPYEVINKLRSSEMGISSDSSERLANAFGKLSTEVWVPENPEISADAGNFYWLASTWDRSSQVIGTLGQDVLPEALLATNPENEFIINRVDQLIQDGTVNRFYDEFGVDELGAEDVASYLNEVNQQSRKAIVGLLASAGYREQDITEATGFNSNTVRNSIFELRKQGVLPDANGSARWIAKNGATVLEDFRAGSSKRNLMKKYGIGARTLDSILAPSDERLAVRDSYGEDPSASMANPRLPDGQSMSDGPSDDWRESRLRKADGSEISPELQAPPALVGNPFVNGSPASLDLSGRVKNPENMKFWAKVISDWTSMSTEGGYFASKPSTRSDPAENILQRIFGDVAKDGLTDAEFSLGIDGLGFEMTAKGVSAMDFDIATRRENPSLTMFAIETVPAVLRREFVGTGIYRGLLPMMRSMLAGSFDRYVRKLGGGNSDYLEVTTGELLEAGILDSPEMPEDLSDSTRMKLFELQQMIRNPNMVDAPPLFEEGDEKIMALLIPIMAAADEKLLLDSQYGFRDPGVLGESSNSIGSSTMLGDVAMSPDDQLSGVPMFSNILVGSILSGNLKANKLLNELTPRQIMLSNWVYGIYTAMDPIVNSFMSMMPYREIQTSNQNVPEEPGLSDLLGQPYYLPVVEVDDQVFAFAFDSVFKSIQGAIDNPAMLLMESLPTSDWQFLYSDADSSNFEMAEKLRVSAKVMAKVVADSLATALYRKAVQSVARGDMVENSTPFYTGNSPDTGYFRFARPRKDSYGHWSMNGPNVVYSGEGLDPYVPGWDDQSNILSEIGGSGAAMSEDAVAQQQKIINELQQIVDETPGKYWWETESAYGRLTEEQIISMHPEEFADYVSSMSMFEEGDLGDAPPSAILRRTIGKLTAMSFPQADINRFDEWLGPIIDGLPEGKVTKEAVLEQLQNIFPWLDLNNPDDIYPITGNSLEESIEEMRSVLINESQDNMDDMYQRKPQLRAIETALRNPLGGSSLDNGKSLMSLFKGLMAVHRTNVSEGFRRTSAFLMGLRRLMDGVQKSESEILLDSLTTMVNRLGDEGRINNNTAFALILEISRVRSHLMFGDFVTGEKVMDFLLRNGDQADFYDLLEKTGADDYPSLTEDDREFLENFGRLVVRTRSAAGDQFERQIRSGIFGSVKTLGEAAVEMAPFIEATQKTSRRRALLPRYKREIIDPIQDQLLSDVEKMNTIPTYNEWLDANGHTDLTYDKDVGEDEARASMSALTRAVIARYTNEAANAVIEAYEEAAGGSNELNLAHLLVGAWKTISLRDSQSFGSVSGGLRDLGVGLDRITQALSSLVGKKEGITTKPTGFTSASRRALIGAIKAANRRGEEYIDLGDLIQAVLIPDLRGNGDDDGIMEALQKFDISPFLISATISASRMSDLKMPPPTNSNEDPSAAMSATRRAINLKDKINDAERSKLTSARQWFNAGRSDSILDGSANDAQLVDELERLMDVYARAQNLQELGPRDFRGGTSPFSAGAIRFTNSVLVHGENGQEPSDLIGAIRQATEKAQALLTDSRQTKRLEDLISSMHLYFDNDEHLFVPPAGEDPSASMSKDFSDEIRPVRDMFARKESTSQKRYFEGIYGDVDLAESELQKATEIELLRGPFQLSNNLNGSEDDVNWSTGQWSFNKDDLAIQASDSVMIRMKNGDISTAELVMISRKSGPFRDSMALVGGLRDGDEDLMTTATRETMEEVGVSLDLTDQAEYLGTIEAPDWDPRFVNGIRVGAGLFVIPWETELSAASDADSARFVPLSEIAAGRHRLAFGHAEWIRRAVASMRIDPESDPFGDIRFSIARRLGILSKASRLRNQRLIEQVNSVRQATGKKLFPRRDRMPHPMMAWGNKISKAEWGFKSSDEISASMTGGIPPFVDESLAADLNLLSVQSTMPASSLSNGANTAGFYKVGHSRGGDDLYAAWGDKQRVEDLWRPFVERSLERAKVGQSSRKDIRPTVYILGGSSATGKSSARNSGLFGIPNYGEAVVSDPDDAKSVMPEARLWYARRLTEASGLVHAESRQVAAIMARAATEAGLDLVYDTSGQFNDGFQDISDWRKKGYNVVAHYFFAPLSVLQPRVTERATRTGRGVPASIVDTMHRNLVSMIPDMIASQLFDELYIWDSEKDVNKPLLIGQVEAGVSGQPSNLLVKHPYLFRYFYTDRVAPDGGKIEPRRTTIITIPYER